MKVYRHLLSMTLVAGIFWVLSRMVDWNSAIATVSGVNLELILTGVSLTLFWPLIGAARWQRVLAALEISVDFSKALKAVMIAFSANILAPAKSGDLVKVLVMGEVGRKKVLTAGVVAERMGDLLILCLFSAIGGLSIGRFLEAGIGASVVIGVLASIVVIGRVHLKHRQVWLQKLWQIVQNASNLWVDRFSQMRQAMLLSGLNWILASVQIWLFFQALGVTVTFLTVLSLFPITVLVTLLPITPGGLGVRESAFVLLFLPYAEPHSSIVASLGYYICNTGITALLGVAFIHSHLSGQEGPAYSSKIFRDEK